MSEKLGWTRKDFFLYAMHDDKVRQDINQNILNLTANLNRAMFEEMRKSLGMNKDAGN